MNRRFGVPKEIQSSISKIITGLGYSVSRPKELASAILKTSDHFNQTDKQITPWSKHETVAAYLSYYLPLGIARAQAVIQTAQSIGFFQNVQSFVDWGSGPGTLSLVLRPLLQNGICIELSHEAIELHQKLMIDRKILKWQSQMTVKEIELLRSNKGTLLAFSYSLNELNEIPDWLYTADSLLIIEPSTNQSFLRLAELRSKLIERGWSIWAPCTHSQKCPLQNEKDWCHDRIFFDPPDWWTELESNLPMKNKTITYSYLLAKKTESVSEETLKKNTQNIFSAVENEAAIVGKLSRLVGDLKEEKGKTRQLVCRNSEREFLAWLHKEGHAPDWHRGELVLISDLCDKVSNEIRKKKITKPS